jgi:tetratricopeptide (TPR) repeat protein
MLKIEKTSSAAGMLLGAKRTLGIMLAVVMYAAAQTSNTTVPLLENLGDHQLAITTNSPITQRYFNQGMRLYYAFNHAEAIRAFEEAVRHDTDCAMCYWGVSLSYGPNINLPMDRTAGLSAYEALKKALALETKANAKERAFIRALAVRYASDPPEARTALDIAYSREMRDLVQRYPDDLEAATLYAESLMDLSPWNYWTPEGQPRADTPAMLMQLERVMKANPSHPGANHFYIHAVEAVQPERAVVAAEQLAKLMPGAGHIVHMPGHIYIRVGRFLDAIAANEHAVHADETYIRDQSPAFGPYTAAYYPHNYDFLAFAASMIGRSRQTITAAEKMTSLVPQELLKEPGMTFAQHHQTRHLQMKVRFSRWEDILKTTAPPQDLPHGGAMWNYARGRALAARGDVQAAEAALAALQATATDPQVAPLRLEFNTSGQVLAVAVEVLAGFIEMAKGDSAQAVSHLQAALRLEDGLKYGEPPEWSIPVRNELGDVLLKAGQNADAERAFKEDLKRFPDNGWSLLGLERALRAQGRTAEANNVAARFRNAWSTADVPEPAGL